MLRPLIRANVRRTARRSAFWKSRDTGSPVNGGGCWPAGCARRGVRPGAVGGDGRAEQRYQDQRSETSHAYRSS